MLISTRLKEEFNLLDIVKYDLAIESVVIYLKKAVQVTTESLCLGYIAKFTGL